TQRHPAWRIRLAQQPALERSVRHLAKRYSARIAVQQAGSRGRDQRDRGTDAEAMSAANSYRLFIAIELPAEVRRHIKEYVYTLRHGYPDVRASWTREDNMHLTLKFLGDTPIDKVESLNHALQRATNQISRFEIVIHRTGSFPSHGKPNVLWIGIDDPSGNLRKLHEQLEQECSRASFTLDER